MTTKNNPSQTNTTITEEHKQYTNNTQTIHGRDRRTEQALPARPVGRKNKRQEEQNT